MADDQNPTSDNGIVDDDKVENFGDLNENRIPDRVDPMSDQAEAGPQIQDEEQEKEDAVRKAVGDEEVESAEAAALHQDVKSANDLSRAESLVDDLDKEELK